MSYLEHASVRSFVTAQHRSRDAAITRMAVLLADHFNAEIVRRTEHPLHAAQWGRVSDR